MVDIFAWLQEWATVISGLGSLGLTIGLVYLYRRQQGLLERELNREVQRNHTRILKERIRAWHGDLDEVGSTDADPLSDDTNVPTVQAASVKPAPPIMKVVGHDPEFRVVPERIEDDRYLNDLLENHAPELRALKETIEGQYDDFTTAKQAFLDAYPTAEAIETENYILEPKDWFQEWVFERAVVLHREYRERDKDKMRQIVESALDDSSGVNVDTGTRFYDPKNADGGHSTYRATAQSNELDDLAEFEDEIAETLIRTHKEAIDDISDERFYTHAIRAAQTLDAMEETIQDLKGKLVEHEGHPLYTEDCDYMAGVQNGSHALHLLK